MSKNAFKHAAMNMGRMVGDMGIHDDMKALRTAKKKAPGGEAMQEHPGPQEDLTHTDLAHAHRPKNPKSGADLGEGDDATEQYEDESKFGHHANSKEESKEELTEKSGMGKEVSTKRTPGHEGGAHAPGPGSRETEDQADKPVGAVARMENSFKAKPKRTVTLNGAASFGNKRK